MPFTGSVHLQWPCAHRAGAAERGLTSQVRAHVYSAHARLGETRAPSQTTARTAMQPHTSVLVCSAHTSVYMTL